ncbi:MAG: transcriptional regulator [Nitrospirota bacterium]
MKKKKFQKAFTPVERHETIRQRIISLLEGGTLSAREISLEVGVSEKEVYDHLEHIQLAFNKKKLPFKISPASCRKCGFVFRKRDRLKKPGRCPVCHGELIREPLFSLGTRR